MDADLFHACRFEMILDDVIVKAYQVILKYDDAEDDISRGNSLWKSSAGAAKGLSTSFP